jgi:hypothetical protein
MEKIRFFGRWRSLIMTCVMTVTYLVVVNGKPVGNIMPSRGLRQGNPISPYLFLLCVEALSSKLSKAESMGVITGVPTKIESPIFRK